MTSQNPFVQRTQIACYFPEKERDFFADRRNIRKNNYIMLKLERNILSLTLIFDVIRYLSKRKREKEVGARAGVDKSIISGMLEAISDISSKFLKALEIANERDSIDFGQEEEEAKEKGVDLDALLVQSEEATTKYETLFENSVTAVLLTETQTSDNEEELHTLVEERLAIISLDNVTEKLRPLRETEPAGMVANPQGNIINDMRQKMMDTLANADPHHQYSSISSAIPNIQRSAPSGFFANVQPDERVAAAASASASAIGFDSDIFVFNSRIMQLQSTLRISRKSELYESLDDLRKRSNEYFMHNSGVETKRDTLVKDGCQALLMTVRLFIDHLNEKYRGQIRTTKYVEKEKYSAGDFDMSLLETNYGMAEGLHIKYRGSTTELPKYFASEETMQYLENIDKAFKSDAYKNFYEKYFQTSEKWKQSPKLTFEVIGTREQWRTITTADDLRIMNDLLFEQIKWARKYFHWLYALVAAPTMWGSISNADDAEAFGVRATTTYLIGVCVVWHHFSNAIMSFLEKIGNYPSDVISGLAGGGGGAAAAGGTAGLVSIMGIDVYSIGKLVFLISVTVLIGSKLLYAMISTKDLPWGVYGINKNVLSIFSQVLHMFRYLVSLAITHVISYVFLIEFVPQLYSAYISEKDMFSTYVGLLLVIIVNLLISYISMGVGKLFGSKTVLPSFATIFTFWERSTGAFKAFANLLTSPLYLAARESYANWFRASSITSTFMNMFTMAVFFGAGRTSEFEKKLSEQKTIEFEEITPYNFNLLNIWMGFFLKDKSSTLSRADAPVSTLSGYRLSKFVQWLSYFTNPLGSNWEALQAKKSSGWLEYAAQGIYCAFSTFLGTIAYSIFRYAVPVAAAAAKFLGESAFVSVGKSGAEVKNVSDQCNDYDNNPHIYETNVTVTPTGSNVVCGIAHASPLVKDELTASPFIVAFDIAARGTSSATGDQTYLVGFQFQHLANTTLNSLKNNEGSYEGKLDYMLNKFNVDKNHSLPMIANAMIYHSREFSAFLNLTDKNAWMTVFNENTTAASFVSELTQTDSQSFLNKYAELQRSAQKFIDKWFGTASTDAVILSYKRVFETNPLLALFWSETKVAVRQSGDIVKIADAVNYVTSKMEKSSFQPGETVPLTEIVNPIPKTENSGAVVAYVDYDANLRNQIGFVFKKILEYLGHETTPTGHCHGKGGHRFSGHGARKPLTITTTTRKGFKSVIRLNRDDLSLSPTYFNDIYFTAPMELYVNDLLQHFYDLSSAPKVSLLLLDETVQTQLYKTHANFSQFVDDVCTSAMSVSRGYGSSGHTTLQRENVEVAVQLDHEVLWWKKLVLIGDDDTEHDRQLLTLYSEVEKAALTSVQLKKTINTSNINHWNFLKKIIFQLALMYDNKARH